MNNKGKLRINIRGISTAVFALRGKSTLTAVWLTSKKCYFYSRSLIDTANTHPCQTVIFYTAQNLQPIEILRQK